MINVKKNNSLIRLREFIRKPVYSFANLKFFLVVGINIFCLHRGVAQEVPSTFKKPIVYISTKNNEGKYVPGGTAFFVGVRHMLDSTRLYTYLVTARHVLQSYNKATADTIEIRVNTNQGGSESGRLILYYSGKNKNVFFNSDPSVDIAVIPFYIDQTKYSYVPYPSELLFKSKLEFDSSYVKEGTSVFYTGMFVPYLGYKKVSPIIRFGKVAMIPDEKIQWENGAPSELFFVETTTFGGNSGSPLFSLFSPIKFDGSVVFKGLEPKLVGVIKGYYGERQALEIVRNNTANNMPMYTSNVGITSVIPSYLIYEILFSKDVSLFRSNGK